MRIIVYCGASEGNAPVYLENARTLGKWIADNRHSLVYGGGNVGLMGEVANTVLKYDGRVVGVIPKFLADREIAHNGLTDLIVVDNMSERKNKILEVGDVCIALPGGPGTLEEISEVVSWSRIGQNDRPCILYNESGYYDLLEAFYDNMVDKGFLTQADRDNVYFVKSVEALNEVIDNYSRPAIRIYKK